jgi:hypothetical protein
VPRPPRSIRTISAYADGTPHGVNVYRSMETPSKVFAYYDAKMRESGWLGYDPQLDDTKGRAYLKNGVVVTLAATEAPEGNHYALGLSGVNAEEDKLGRK